MRIWWHLFRGFVGLAAGSVVCWWKDDHVVSWQAGILPRTAWGGVPFDGFSLNSDPGSSSNRYWERTYCIRCGATLKEETP
jgi:hypothetical protein